MIPALQPTTRALCGLAPFLLLGCGLLLHAATLQLEVSETAVPEEVPTGLREALQPVRLLIHSDGSSLFEFWLVQEPDTGGENAGVFGIGIGELKPGSLLGVVRVGQNWMDYKNKPVRPGVYSLRYGLQPADGNHMGVSAYRDFAVLLPFSEDTDAQATYEYAELVRKAALASGTPHPSIMGLFPLDEESAEPSVVENEEGQPMIAVQIGSVGLGLVLEGHGEVKGY